MTHVSVTYDTCKRFEITSNFSKSHTFAADIYKGYYLFLNYYFL